MITGTLIDRIHAALMAYRIARNAEPAELALPAAPDSDDPTSMFGIPIVVDGTVPLGQFELRDSRSIDCPDCGQPWNLGRQPACPHCGLTTEALDDAAAHLAQIDAENDDERNEVEL